MGKEVSQKRALFLPGYFGNGFGHVGRCLALADEMKKENWKVGMVLAGRYCKLVKENGYDLFSPIFPKRPSTKFSDQNTPAFTYIKDGSGQVLRDGLTSLWKIKAAVAELMLIVKKFRPNVLIGDISLLTWILGKKVNLPVVQIIRSIMYPGRSKIIWWQDPPQGMESPNIAAVFNPLLEKWKISAIKSVDYLLQGDLYLVPSIPELEPLPDNVINTHYVGAMVYKQKFKNNLPEPLLNDNQKQKVYITMGGGAGGVGNLKFFEIIHKAFSQTPWTTIVSTGKNFNPKDIPELSKNIYYSQWVPGPEVIKRSDLVIFPGGYGTMMETIKFGVPSIIVPFHSEQESNGRRIAENNAGCLLSSAEKSDRDTLIPYKCKYGKFVGCIRKEFNLKPHVLNDSAENILKNCEYKKAAMRLSSLVNKFNREKAVELIKKMV
ncbi:MAG: nucleotide disphospho-sugar-binding domain-containing protein [Candidatus Omnitrophota bacterium]